MRVCALVMFFCQMISACANFLTFLKTSCILNSSKKENFKIFINSSHNFLYLIKFTKFAR